MKAVRIKVVTVLGSVVLFLLTTAGEVNPSAILIGLLLLLLVEGGWVSVFGLSMKSPNKRLHLLIIGLSVSLALAAGGSLWCFGKADLGFAVLSAAAIAGFSSLVLVSPIKEEVDVSDDKQPKLG